MKPKGFVNSVGKADEIIDAFKIKDELTVTELSKMLDYYPSVIHRFLTSLVHLGYIEQNTESGKYRLGLKFLEIGYLVFKRMDLRERVRPVLKELANISGETANLAIFDENDGRVMFIDQIESPRDITMKLRVGFHARLHSTALGKVIFAHLPDDRAEEIFRKTEFVRLTRNTITDPEELKKHLEAVRQNGFAIDNEEGVEGATCIAAPLRDHTGQVVAAISISALSKSINIGNIEEKVELVKQSALEASSQLGYKQQAAIEAV